MLKRLVKRLSNAARIQINIVKEHHTRTAGLKIILVANANIELIDIAQVYALVRKFLQHNIPFRPSTYLCNPPLLDRATYICSAALAATVGISTPMACCDHVCGLTAPVVWTLEN